MTDAQRHPADRARDDLATASDRASERGSWAGRALVVALSAAALVFPAAASAASKIKFRADHGKLDRMTLTARASLDADLDSEPALVRVEVANPFGSVYAEELPVGKLVADSSGSRWKYKARRDGTTELIHQLTVRKKTDPADGKRRYTFKIAIEADLAAADPERSPQSETELARMTIELAIGEHAFLVDDDWQRVRGGWRAHVEHAVGLLGGPRKRVFVSSQCYDANLTGLGGADAECQGLATAASLPGSYLAWMADASNSPRTRFTRSATPYVLVDDTLVAADWDDLTGGELRAPIALDENGLSPGGPCGDEVWTNVTYDGGAANGDGYEFVCFDWTSAQFSHSALTGNRMETGPGWTDGGAFAYRACSSPARLYCFEQ